MTVNLKLLEILSSLTEQSMTKLDQLSGGHSICQLHKRGEVSGGLKAVEGEVFLFRRMLRLVEKGADTNMLNAELTLLERKYLAIQQSLVLSSPAWQVYATAVLASIAQVKKLLSAATPSE